MQRSPRWIIGRWSAAGFICCSRSRFTARKVGGGSRRALPRRELPPALPPSCAATRRCTSTTLSVYSLLSLSTTFHIPWHPGTVGPGVRWLTTRSPGLCSTRYVFTCASGSISSWPTCLVGLNGEDIVEGAATAGIEENGKICRYAMCLFRRVQRRGTRREWMPRRQIDAPAAVREISIETRDSGPDRIHR